MDHTILTKIPDIQTLEWIDQLTYDPNLGKVFKNGREIGYVDKSTGYVRIEGCGRKLRRSHIAWYKYYGEWPKQLIDHISRTKTDDRIENLRIADWSLNNSNRDKKHDLPEGVTTGPNFSVHKPFQASIYIKGKMKYLGCYVSPEEASKVYQEAKRNR